MSKFDGDNSSIRNSYDFVDAISSNKVFALLHGHTHGCSNITVGNSCKVIGVGPLFKVIPDILNQFNFINIVADNIDTIDNFSYRSDLDEFSEKCLYTNNNNSCYKGNSLKHLYYQVVENVKAYGCLNNFNLNIETDVRSFEAEISDMFADKIPIAEQWQQKDCPETLYYNHGMILGGGGIDGIDYIVKELKDKATSSRAILPLISVDDVKKSGHGFLPSLDIIQFGFESEDKTNLYVTIYLRALEVNHFLKINLCEIYLMVNRIKLSIRSITSLNISVLSFRAQYKERFGCFQKAEIDTISGKKIMMYVADRNFNKIIHLLKNKLDLTETVIKEHGVISLCESIAIYNEENVNVYSNELLTNINKLLTLYKDLVSISHKTSIYSELKPKENEITDQMKHVIELFEHMGNEL